MFFKCERLNNNIVFDNNLYSFNQNKDQMMVFVIANYIDN